MKSNHSEKRLWRFTCGRWISVAFIFVLAAAAQSTAAQSTVVVGTGNPDTDISAVQAAVNNGGKVILHGHFSFNRTPTVPTSTNGALAMVLVSQPVAISGA